MLFLDKFKNLFKKWPFWSLVVAALLLSFSLPPLKLFPLAFVSLIPFFYFLESTESRSKIFKGSLIFGFVFYGSVILWFFSVLPLDWAGIYNEYFGFLIMLFIWFLTSLAMGLTVVGFGALYKLLPKKGKVFLIPAIWIIFDYLSSFAFSTLWAGNNLTTGPFWAFGSIGYIFSSIPFALYFSKIIGLYGASYLIVFVNVIFFSVLKSQNKKRTLLNFVLLAASFLFILFLVQKFVFEPNLRITEKKDVSLIQTYVAFSRNPFSGSILTIAGQGMSLLEKVNANSKMIIFPEESFFNRDFFESKKEKYSFLNKDIEIVSNVEAENGKPEAREIIKYFPYYKKEEVLSQKIVLTPFGEYLPNIFRFPIIIFGGEKWVGSYDFYHPFIKGNNFYSKKYKEAALLCSAVFSPTFWEKAANQGAEIFISPVSQRFFKGSSYYDQIEMAVRFFAAENDKWMLIAANGGYSYIIDENGNVIKKSKSNNKAELVEGEVEYRKGITFASRFENWAVWLSVFIISIILFKKCFYQIKKKQ